MWTHPTWTALNFSVDDAHAYSYQFEVNPDGQSFTARALGDLDCDGVYSTFETVVAVDKDGEFQGTGEIQIANEFE